MTFVKGDTELNEYMDSLAREPERLTTPHNTDTGETIMHLLAKVMYNRNIVDYIQ